ncbi:O-succinylbenzoate synthase [Alkalibacillus flavidus]|uniref:o-succinylbenzoate synthase n=1 Tax=Alkalibacillus flavidus TaxID=546021 RepID=A0ABV2KVK9_9BACI
MNLKDVVVRQVAMKLKQPFQTANGLVVTRDTLIIEAYDHDGYVGYGECVAFADPFYTPETTTTAWDMLKHFILPVIQKSRIDHPNQVHDTLSSIQGHQMAKASIETALWDLYAKQQGMPLKDILGGVYDHVESGVVLSLSDDLSSQVKHYKKKGYKRYKLKVQKGQERETIDKARQVLGDAPIMFDGNGIYEPEDMLHLTKLDDLDLHMIEQPFRQDDFFYHHQLRKEMKTKICLDESIQSEHDAFQAMELGAADTFNVKLGRVGGYHVAQMIHHYAKVANMPLWCGGMLETGIGRAHNVILASLEQFTLPGDLSESERYWEQDIIKQPFKVKNGLVQVPTKPGIGVTVDHKLMDKLTVRQFTFDLATTQQL